MIRPLGKGLALIALVAATLTSCKKDKDSNEPIAVTKANLLGTYTLIEIREKVGADEEMSTTNEWLEECQKDDKVTLHSDQTYSYSDEGTECDPNGDDSGTWELNESTKEFKIDDGEVGGLIEKLTADELVIHQQQTVGAFTYSMRWIYKKF